MGGGRGLGGEQAAELFRHLQAALVEKETQDGERRGGQGDINNQALSFDECISNVGLWLQLASLVSQGVQESIAEAQRAFPELAVLAELLERGGPAALHHALLPNAAGPAPITTVAEAPAPLLDVQVQPTDVQADPAMLHALLHLIQTHAEQAQALQTPGPSAASAPPPHQGHLLQQYFNSAPLPAQWNAPHATSNHLQTTVSAPAGGMSATAANYNAIAAHFHMQQEHANLAKRQRLGNTPSEQLHNYTTGNAYTSLPAGVAMAGGLQEKRCSNCGASNTPFWRKDRSSKLSLCNACGLYAAKNDHPRPFRLWKEGQNVDHLIAAEAEAAAAAAIASGGTNGTAGATQKHQYQQEEGHVTNIAAMNPVQQSAEGLNVFRTVMVARNQEIGGADGDAKASSAGDAEAAATTSDAINDAYQQYHGNI
ncbi:hypothetical protein Ndes2526B_g01933 [Nannochloris sp. 'desiccata']|nr:putative Transcription factor elt-1 [Chlorella desiccata (nom. nud.)]